MIDNVLDGVIACSDVFGSHGRVRLKKRHVVAAVSFAVPMEVDYGLSMRHGNREGDRIC